MRLSVSLLFVPCLALAACSSKTDPTPPAADASADAPVIMPPADDAGDAAPAHAGPVDKIDLLFMVDNSASMGDKQALLRTAVPDLLNRLVNPQCVDDTGKVLGASTNGACAAGKPEFPPVRDLHVGIVSSSLGGRGSDECSPTFPNPANPSLNSHSDDQGHLITRAGDDEHTNADAASSGFLSFVPGGDAHQLVTDFEDIVSGVHEYGCGFEAQLESWYRFLVQPDPYGSISAVDQATGRVSLVGTDDVVLKQRHDFLRPDSLVAVILLTDENDSTTDPMALSGQGWVYENSAFPGSTTGGGAAKGTSACVTNPNDAACTSCGLCQNGAPAAICNDATCKAGAFYTPQEDSMNERFFHMKQRFGVDPQFPIARYVTGLTATKVPDRNGEHPLDAQGAPSPFYVGTATCTNPLFASSLPSSSKDELCALPQGTRTPDRVLFAVIGGVPSDLLHFDPNVPDSSRLTPADWTKILGNDPLKYDFGGVDPRMLESMRPRPGVTGDYDTAGADLEYACTFDLPAPKDCTTQANKFACDCEPGRTTPLCDPTTPTTQVKGKAYPTIRELAVARQLGDQAVVASICPAHVTEQGAGDPLYGYRPAVKAIGDRIAKIVAAK